MANSKKARPDGGASGRAAGYDRAGQQSHNKQYNTVQDGKARTIYDLLPVGAEYAISRRQLSAITGIPDRQLRRRIAEERRAGCLSYPRRQRSAEDTSVPLMCRNCAGGLP